MSLDTLSWAKFYVSKGWHVIPLQPRSKKPALQEGQVLQWRKQLPSHDVLVGWFGETDNNIGIITGNLAVVDIDSEDGIKVFKENVLDDTSQTPLVKTNRGYHLYFNPIQQGVGSRPKFLRDCDLKASGGYVVAPPSLNGSGQPYTWIRRPDQYQLQPLPSQILSKIGSTTSNLQPSQPFSLTQGARDDTLYSIAVSLFKGGLPRQHAEGVLRILAGSCSPPFSPEIAIEKVRSAYENLPSDRNLSTEVEEWVNDSHGIFRIGELLRSLNADKKTERNIRGKVKRLVDQGVLERVTSKGNGFYRRVIQDVVPIDYKGAVEAAKFDLDWPSAFGFGSMFYLYPGNIAVLAGSSNAGKTAMMLNLVVLNQHKYPVNYFSNELYAPELKARLELFPDRDLGRMTFNAYELTANFQDQIEKNALNIIDYWQPGEEGAFWQIAEDLDKVHKKLDGTGLAVVCVQKKREQELGRGAEFSLERPRLYMSMDFQRLRLTKVKLPVPGKDANGRVYRFKLINGCEFRDVQDITDERD